MTDPNQSTEPRHVDDINDPVLRGLAAEYDHWMAGVRWALGDVSKHDLKMMIEDYGGPQAVQGLDSRLVDMARRLVEYAND